MQKRFITTAMAGALALSVAACGGGDSLGPTIELTQTQTEDMLEALTAIGDFSDAFGFGVASASLRSLVRNPDMALATSAMDATEDCPDGGTHRVKGSLTTNETGSSGSINVTQTFNNCRATSSSGTLWTFNGAPNIKLILNANFNESTGAFSITGSQIGAINAASTLGSGSCVINLSFSISGNEFDETFSGSVTGTVCGKPVNESIL